MNTPTLRFKEFSGEWEFKKLGDIADLTSSKRVYLSDYVNEGIAFYRGKEISELKRNEKPKDVLYISREAYETFKTGFGVPQVNDILITAVGTLGNVYRIKNNSEFYFKDGNLIWLKNVKILSAFLEILLEINHEAIQKSSIGSTQRALTIIELKKLKFVIPPLQEQTKIANFLTAIDEKIAQLSQTAQLLTDYKKGVMQQIFSQQLRFKDDDGREFDEWEEKKIIDIATIIGGGTPDTTVPDYWNGDVQWFTPTELKSKYTQKSLRTITQKGLKDSSAKILPIGALLLSSRATVGDVSIALTECTTNQGFQSLIVNNQNSNLFVYYWILNNKNLFLEKSSGSTFLEISKKEIEKLKINIPSLPEQTKIANFLTAIDDKINNNQTQLDAMKQYKAGLLQQMFV